MVVNAIDPNPPERAAKLYMTDPEWRSLVFPLISEAAVTVLVLPPEHQGRHRHHAPEPGRRPGLLGDTHGRCFPGAILHPGLPEVLRDWGFGVVLREQEVAANPALLVEAVLARLKS